MSSDHAGSQTPSIDKSSRSMSIAQWAVIAGVFVLLLPALFMSLMMLGMAWFGPPMHGGMGASGLGLFRVVGVIPLLLVLGVMYGAYRLSAGNTG